MISKNLHFCMSCKKAKVSICELYLEKCECGGLFEYMGKASKSQEDYLNSNPDFRLNNSLDITYPGMVKRHLEKRVNFLKKIVDKVFIPTLPQQINK